MFEFLIPEATYICSQLTIVSKAFRFITTESAFEVGRMRSRGVYLKAVEDFKLQILLTKLFYLRMVEGKISFQKIYVSL